MKPPVKTATFLLCLLLSPWAGSIASGGDVLVSRKTQNERPQGQLQLHPARPLFSGSQKRLVFQAGFSTLAFYGHH